MASQNRAACIRACGGLARLNLVEVNPHSVSPRLDKAHAPPITERSLIHPRGRVFHCTRRLKVQYAFRNQQEYLAGTSQKIDYDQGTGFNFVRINEIQSNSSFLEPGDISRRVE
jgi:hypothetical protein